MKQRGLISDIQHFCVSDGDGIRTTVFFKGCNLRCRWCHNVECIGGAPQEMRYTINGRESVRVCGRYLTEAETVEEISEDGKFYERSGGGVTFSGGEPLLQIDFLVGVMKQVKKLGIHTIVDTAGNVSFETFEKAMPYTDTFFFDVKAANAADYLTYTNGDFDNIMANLRGLIERNADVVVRIPVIPGHNDSEKYMEETCALLCEAGVKKVNLLPFNRLGGAKYAALGLEYAYKDVKTLQKEDLASLLIVCKKYFDAKTDG